MMHQHHAAKQTSAQQPIMSPRIASNMPVTKWLNRAVVITLLLAVYVAGRDDGIRTLHSRPCQPLPESTQ